MSLTVTVVALGIAQIVSWGTLFYTIAVLGPALREATGVSELTLHAFYSAGLFVSGIVSPAVGRAIDSQGGRRVLSAGSIFAAIACAALAVVQGPVSLLAAWLLVGFAMALTLYDPAFATLHAIASGHYRRAVTALTLFGGFASTVFWPLSQVLLDGFGMRATFAFYAVLHLVLCLPLHLGLVPRHAVNPVVHADPPGHAKVDTRSTFAWLAIALAIASFIASAMSAHFIGLLTEKGMSARDAVLIGALIGPMQVVGRLMEFSTSRHVSVVLAGTIAFATMAAAQILFTQLDASFALAVVFAALYGWSNGVVTIVRGTVPAELFGREAYGALLGVLAKPQFIARAVAPAALAALLLVDSERHLALTFLAILGVLALVAYQRAIRRR
ncbi:MAG TPA: MFS transporter [Casimicrobiaceae bacterium]|nr:MFS transporter [Casimicrobiaceae bacterium]